MSTIVLAIGWLSALAAGLTAMAMLQDITLQPEGHDLRSWVRHIAKQVCLVVIVGCAGIAVVFPAAMAGPWPETLLRASLACFMAMQSPCPWWRYVFLDHRKHQPRPMTETMT